MGIDVGLLVLLTPLGNGDSVGIDDGETDGWVVGVVGQELG